MWGVRFWLLRAIPSIDESSRDKGASLLLFCLARWILRIARARARAAGGATTAAPFALFNSLLWCSRVAVLAALYNAHCCVKMAPKRSLISRVTSHRADTG